MKKKLIFFNSRPRKALKLTLIDIRCYLSNTVECFFTQNLRVSFSLRCQFMRVLIVNS